MGFRNLIVFLSFLQIGCSAQRLSFEDTADGILISEDGKQVLFYQRTTKSKDGKYPRANYIHPLYGIDGAVLTQDFPTDHPHQRGVFWAWHQVIIDDLPIGDAWECRDFIWDVVKAEPTSKENGNMVITTETLWKSPLWTDKEGVPEAFLKENAKITIRPSTNNYRIIDFEINLLALVPKLKIGGSDDEKGYGGFSVRMKTPNDIKFTSSHGGVVPTIEALQAGPWMDISGSLAADGQKAGIIIINHTDNTPHSWILREKESMQNIAYPGREPVYISDKIPTVLKYRMVIYLGETSEGVTELSR